MADVLIKFKYKNVINHSVFFIGGQPPEEYQDYDIGTKEITDEAYHVDIEQGVLSIRFLAESDSEGYFKILELSVDDETIGLNQSNDRAYEDDNRIEYEYNFIL